VVDGDLEHAAVVALCKHLPAPVFVEEPRVEPALHEAAVDEFGDVAAVEAIAGAVVRRQFGRVVEAVGREGVLAVSAS
jgi:hypothetical protein